MTAAMWHLGIINFTDPVLWLFIVGMACAVAAGWFTWVAVRRL